MVRYDDGEATDEADPRGWQSSDRTDTARPPLPTGTRLALAIVHYSDRPDRCTVYPPDASGVARLTNWLSVDCDLLCSLEDWR